MNARKRPSGDHDGDSGCRDAVVEPATIVDSVESSARTMID
jgi:hypothetical protein